MISAVGHETDFTICDFVADRRAPTPSAAAEIALPETAELKRKINNIISRECAVLTQVITRHRGSVKRLSETRSLRSPMNFIDDKRMHVGTLTERLALSQTNALAIRQSQLKAIAGKMEALNPLSVLSRGYSAVYGENGEIIKHTEQLTPGASITFRLADGEADAQIREVRRNET
jgi:exodeoxyribonuclease VII large subunit